MEKPIVLLADDNEPTTTLLTALLHNDFEIDVVSDGADAIERLKTRSYAAVILDLLMPEVDGFGVLEFVRQHSPEVLKRILVVSAALTRRELDRLEPYDVCGIISKPFEVDSLLAAVRKCTGDARPLRGSILNSGVIFLLAEMLRRQWM